jgi:hypothetical protein
MARKEDLERNILQSDAIIREYRDKIQFATDPMERLRSERAIRQQQELIRGYLDEYVPLCRRFNMAVPKGIAQIIALLNEETSETAEGPVSGEPHTPPPHTGMPSLDQAQLIEALLACTTVSDAGTRDDIVDKLPTEIRDRIKRRPATRPDVINIVETCSNFEGGLASLVKIVRFYEGPTLQMKQVDALLSET